MNSKKTGRPLGVKTSAGFAISDFTLVSPGLEFQFNCNKTFTKEIKKRRPQKGWWEALRKDPFTSVYVETSLSLEKEF